MKNQRLGVLVREARGDMSLREFARRCGISHTHLDSIEKGFDPRTGKPVRVTVSTLEKLSKATGHSMIFLAGQPGAQLKVDAQNLGVLKGEEEGEEYAEEYTEEVHTPYTLPVDDEIWELRTLLYKRPELKTLLEAARNVKKEDLETVIAIVTALKKRE